jgi:hypothetical protein
VLSNRDVQIPDIIINDIELEVNRLVIIVERRVGVIAIRASKYSLLL